MPYTLTIPIILGSSQTGLTLKAQLFAEGVAVGSEVTTGFTEEGGGGYSWKYAAFPDGFRGTVRFYTGTLPTGLKAFAAINPEEAENTDVKTSSRLAAADVVLHRGQLQDGDPLTLANDASSVDGFYAHNGLLVITSGAGAGQSDLIVGYDGDTRQPTMGGLFVVQPAAGDDYVILATSKVELTGDSVAEIQVEFANEVWGAQTEDFTDDGTFGAVIGGAVDPLANQVPGDYESGTAGAALGRIGVGSIKVTNALTPGGDLYLVKGDDYMVEDGRAIEFTDAESEVKWPVLTDADVVIILQDTEIAGTVVTPTGGEKKVRFELTAEDTEALSTDESRYAVVATLDGGNVVTLTRGRQFTYDNSSNA